MWAQLTQSYYFCFVMSFIIICRAVIVRSTSLLLQFIRVTIVSLQYYNHNITPLSLSFTTIVRKTTTLSTLSITIAIFMRSNSMAILVITVDQGWIICTTMQSLLLEAFLGTKQQQSIRWLYPYSKIWI